MYFKVENSGCRVRRGLVQVRYDLFLDEGDYGYNKRQGKMYDTKGEKYTGDSTKIDDYRKWLEDSGFSYELINVPFHIHFCQFEPTVTDEEILFVGELALKEAREFWDRDEIPRVVNAPIINDLSEEKRIACESRLAGIKATVLQKRDL